jgi:non-specific serine/threonine protein kinase
VAVIGAEVAHYRITAKLGEGGMGAVYRAEDTKLKRQVALKFLPSELAADASARRQMLKEAQVASQLNHPNIATIYEVRDTDEQPFIAMELVEGESLKTILDRGPLPTNRMVDVARQIADGLEEAHAAGVLHRDLKPANVVIDERGRAKILDFGLAVLTGRERSPDEPPDAFMTRSRTQWSTGGTVPYMPPEQLRGETTDVRGDVFSFGVLIYECLSGSYPFEGDTAVDMMASIVSRPFRPLREVVPDVDPEWAIHIERCLAKDPDDRPQTIRALRDSFRPTPPPPPRAEKSVAVLYFENLSREKEDEYFRDGMTEDIITELGKIKELSIFPRSAMLPYRDKAVTAPGIAQELNARYVLEGTLRRGGNRIRITAQLVETGTGRAVWTERFDRDMEDVFAIQDEIAQSIARALRVVLTDKEKEAIRKKETQDVQAYDYYLKGRKFFHQLRRKGFDFARQMFARAIVIDPGYARAYAGVADCCSLLYAFWDATDENLREAEAASRKALELDPELAEAHVSRGLAVSLKKEFDEAEREFETAIQLDPECFEAYYFYARACFTQGRPDKAAALYEKASELRPEDYQAPLLVGTVYDGMGRKTEAEASWRRGLEAVQRHMELHPDDARALYLGAYASCQLGERARSMDLAKRALEIDREEPTTLYNVACVYTRQGRTDEAIDALESAVDYGFTHKAWFDNDPDLAPLREIPRFQKLIERLT